MPPRRARSTEHPQQQARQSESEFRNTLVATAKAAQWRDAFHVIDVGPSAYSRRLTSNLRNAGMNDAADLVSRTVTPRVTASGFPDLNLRHDSLGIIVAELKSDRTNSRPTAKQIDWLLTFAYSLRPPTNPYAPSRAHLWRPAHWPAIDTQLGLSVDPTECTCYICKVCREFPDAPPMHLLSAPNT